MFNFKNMCLVICTVLFIISMPVQFASANVPTVVSISASKSGTHAMVNTEVRHSDPSSSHYIDIIEVDVNGTIYQITGLSPQQTNTFSESYDLGDVVQPSNPRARAHCTIHGWSQWTSTASIASPATFPLELIVMIVVIIIVVIATAIVLFTRGGKPLKFTPKNLTYYFSVKDIDVRKNIKNYRHS